MRKVTEMDDFEWNDIVRTQYWPSFKMSFESVRIYNYYRLT